MLTLLSKATECTFGPLGTDTLAHSHPRPMRKCVSPSEVYCADSVQRQGRHGTALVLLLAQQDLVLAACAVGISSSLADSPKEGPSLPGKGHNLAPAPSSLERLHVGCWM